MMLLSSMFPATPWPPGCHTGLLVDIVCSIGPHQSGLTPGLKVWSTGEVMKGYNKPPDCVLTSPHSLSPIHSLQVRVPIKGPHKTLLSRSKCSLAWWRINLKLLIWRALMLATALLDYFPPKPHRAGGPKCTAGQRQPILGEDLQLFYTAEVFWDSLGSKIFRRTWWWELSRPPLERAWEAWFAGSVSSIETDRFLPGSILPEFITKLSFMKEDPASSSRLIQADYHH